MTLTPEQIKTLDRTDWLLNQLYKEWYCPFKFDGIDADEDADEEEDEENQGFIEIMEAFDKLLKELKEK